MSILEILKLPAGFGYVLLVLGLILSLAPWFHGLDFGVLKIPDFSAPARRVLKAAGPLALALAIGLHVPLLARETPTAAVAGGDEEIPATSLSGTASSAPLTDTPADRTLMTTWKETGCLYPVKPVGEDGHLTTVRFDFGEEAERAADDLFVTTEPVQEIGTEVWVKVPRGDAWAPGSVRDTRTNHFLIKFNSDASCTAAFEKPQAWIRKADISGMSPLEDF